jgi:hypothetical protein
VGLNYQYSFKIIKKYNDFAEEGITNPHSARQNVVCKDSKT